MGICSYTCVEQIRKFVSDAEPSGFKVVMTIVMILESYTSLS